MLSNSGGNSGDQPPDDKARHTRSFLDDYPLSDHSWMKFPPNPCVDDSDLHDKCLQVVELLKAKELDLGKFVWAVCFGNHASRACKKMQAARSSFIKGNYLVPLLENISVLHGLKQKENGLTRQRIYGTIPGVHIRDFINPERLSAMTYTKLKKQVEDHCPTLFKTLHYLSSFNRQKRSSGKANTKNSEFFVVMQISGISYEASQVNNNFQKLLSIYFSGTHVPKAVVELLNRCNICMSYSWTNENIDKLSEEITAKMIEVALNEPFFLSHDNIQIVFGVGSQRGYRKTIANNGTAITMYVLPEAARAIFENPEANNALRLKLHNLRQQGIAPALTWPEINSRQRRSRMFNHRLYHLFDILRSIPGLEKCKVLGDPLLQHPGSWHTLPAGPEHCIKMYMLATQNLDESTYAGNLQVIDTVLRLLKLDQGDPLIRLILERRLMWFGDEMTVQRCRQAQWYRQEEHNGRDRLDPFIFIFGWFHAQMCLAHNVFETSQGSVACLGLQRSVLSLGRKGFAENMQTTCPDYHTVVELLIHEFHARVRGLWMQGAGSSTLEELVSWVKDPSRTAQEILDLGKHIQSERISSQAVSECRQTMDQHNDEVLLSTLITNQDLMMHYDLHHAVKHGHVGEMEDMLPELLIYFTGAGSKNYAREMYEMLQMLYHETTPEMRTAIRTYGFLVNKHGRKDSFYPIDKRQEFNNGGIWQHGPPPHGGADWDRYAKISPVIPVYMDVTEQVERSVTGINRSHIHKDPDAEIDICRLTWDHSSSSLLAAVEGRKPATVKDKFKDCYQLGSITLQDQNGLKKYEERRNLFLRARTTRQELDHFLAPAQPPSASPAPSQSPPATFGSIELDEIDESILAELDARYSDEIVERENVFWEGGVAGDPSVEYE